MLKQAIEKAIKLQYNIYMKKIFIVILSAFLYCIPAFAEYVPIPKHLSKQYKAEIEQIIDEEYPKVVKNIDDYLKYVKSNYNETIKNKCKTDYYLLPEVSIYDLDISVYSKLIKITQEKYLNSKYKTTGTDDSSSLQIYMYPYLIDNNINIKKLEKLGTYAKKKHTIVNRYNKKAQNYCHKAYSD